MPKRVDHEERRRQIADALLRAAATRGLHATGMREVAAEAGVSLRLVQYYFGTKEELLLSAMQQLAAQFSERGLARIRRIKPADGPASPRDVIAAILTEALPADDERRTFTVLHTAYFALSLTDPALAIGPLARNSNIVIDVVAAQLKAAKAASDTPADLDPDLEAVSLLAMSAGLGTSVLGGQSSPEQAQAVIDYHLDRLFPQARPALRRGSMNMTRITLDPGGLLAARRAMSSIRVVTVAMMLLRPLLFPSSWLQNGHVMSMQPVPWPDPDPVVAAAIGAMYGSRKTEPPLAVTVRDRLGEWLRDEEFAGAFGVRGRPGWPPSRLALVTVLQRAENLTDRMAAEAVRTRLDWKYLLGLPLEDPGFDHSVLPEFRAKVADAGLERVPLDALLERLSADGLVKAGGKQRTDSTHVVAAVAELNQLELAGESVRAAVEALTAAHPGWVAAVLHVGEWTRKYGTPVPGWHLPASKKKQDALAVTCAKDGYALLRAVYHEASPSWLAELPAVETLRKVLVQNYTLVIHADGREVVKRREKQPEGDGIPPGRSRIASPYDTDARWGVKRDKCWLGCKLHVTETCDDAPPCGCAGPGHDGDCGAAAFPNLLTCVATTSAAVTDTEMTGAVDDALAAKGLAPGRHYLDSGYLSAGRLVAEAARHGIALIGPLQADTSAQARAGQGYARADFAADYDAQQVTCPQGKTSSSWSPCSQYGRDAIVAIFSRSDCEPCPARELCTKGKRRTVTLQPRAVAEAQAALRAAGNTKSFQADYARRAGIEGTVHQAASRGARRARYRGLRKTRLDHAFMAVALNLLRLNAYWNGNPLDRARTSHLARLELDLAA